MASSCTVCKKNCRFCPGLGDIAVAYDEDHAYFIIVEILGALKEGNGSNHLRLLRRRCGFMGAPGTPSP